MQQTHRLIGERWKCNPQRLRQHHQLQHLAWRQPQHGCSFPLGGRNRLQASANILCDVGRCKQGEGHNRPQNPIDLKPWRQEQRDQQLSKEQHRNQGHSPHQLDVGGAAPTQHRQLTAPAEGQEDPQRKRQSSTASSEQQRERQTTPTARPHRQQTQTSGQQPEPQRCHRDPDQRQPTANPATLRTSEGQQRQRDQCCHPQQRTPALIRRETAHRIQREIGGHHRPVGCHQQPMQHGPASPSEQSQQQQGDPTIQPTVHQRLLFRRPSTARLKAAMPPLINRFSSRKLSNNSRKPSMARPVWVMVVSLTA